MSNKRTYFDFNATAPLRDQAREAVLDAFSSVGNASSVHGEGRRAHACIEHAREAVAALVGVAPDGVTFTSGGTEANHLAFAQVAARGASAILISAIEHPSITAAAEKAGTETGLSVTEIPVTPDGLVDLDALSGLLATCGSRPFVSVMAANNETGVVQPLLAISQLVKEAGGVLHSDAIQVAGKASFDLGSNGVDMATLSAHKIGGLQGVGAFVLATDASVAPRQTGGGQERGRRSGTENVSGIAGFGAAAKTALAELQDGAFERVRALRDDLEGRLQRSGAEVVIFGQGVDRLPNTSCFSAPGLKAETLLMQLDLAGFAVSAGAACSSGKVARSHVLAAMGVEEVLSTGAIRVSLGWSSTEEEVEMFAQAWIRATCTVSGVADRVPTTATTLAVAEG